MKQEQTERNHVLEKAKFTTVSKGAADFRNWPSEVHSRFIHDSHTIYDLRFTIYDYLRYRVRFCLRCQVDRAPSVFLHNSKSQFTSHKARFTIGVI